jgi:hypothetical protein
MRSFVAALAAIVMLLPCSSVALAGWSVPRVLSVTRSSPFASTAVAVDSRGDAAVAWETVGSWPVQSHGRRCPKTQSTTGCLPVSSVHVAVRTADGRLVTRTLWSSRINPTIHLSVVLGRGQATVAWGYYNLTSTSETARAAYGPLIGRWSPSRMIGHFYDVAFTTGKAPWYPQLAAAPNGEVLAAWNACKSSTSASCGFNQRGVVAAWRAPGRGFGVPRVAGAAPLGAIPQFDARGTAYLYSSCSGHVLIAPAHSHRFSRNVVVAPGPVSEFTLSLAGAGRGLAAWVAGACSYDEAVSNTPGPVFVSVLRAGTFAKLLALTPGATRAVYSDAVAVPAGGTVTWSTEEGPTGSAGFSVQIGPDGLPGETQPSTSTVTAAAADGGGDVVFAPSPGSGPVASAVFVRPAGGGADQPAPATYGVLAAAAPVGRAAALAWYTGSTPLELSVWRP